MQDDTQTPGYDAQEPNNTPDPWGADPWGGAANLEGFEEFGQEQPSGEEAADVVGKRLPPWMVRTAAGAGAEEAHQFAPEELAAESEAPAASADLSDPAFYDTGTDADPWGTPSSGTVEQEEGGVFNPLFTTSWEDLGVPSPGTVEQEGEPVFTPPWEDPNAPPPATVEQEEQTFAAPWEDASAAPDPSAFPVGWDNVLDTSPEGQEEEPAFAAPWEDDAPTPELDTSTFAVGWDSVPDTPPEGQEDDPNAAYEEITAAGDIWKDATEGLAEDVGGAFEDVSETVEDHFDDNIF